MAESSGHEEWHQCILFPIKNESTGNNNSREQEKIHAKDELKMTGQLQRDESSSRRENTVDPDANFDVKWVGLTPIAMVERITTMVNKNMNLTPSQTENNPEEGLRVDTEFLASKTPDVFLPPYSSVPKHGNSHKKNKVISPIEETAYNWSPSFSPRTDLNTTEVSFTKRKRRGGGTTDNHAWENVAEGNGRIFRNRLAPWDPSYIAVQDPGSEQALHAADELKKMGEQIEALPKYDQCFFSYQRIRDHLALTSRWIHGGSYISACMDSSDALKEKRFLLDELYKTSLQKMEGLIEIATSQVTLNQVDTNHDNASNYTKLKGTKMIEAAVVAESKKECSKKDFADYMVKWLRENWTNPYPDDDGLMEIARDCNQTTTVVSNWLINARTRKWRPAIIKAYEMGRPADLLKEDAINIFDGKPLRQIEGMTVLKSSPLTNKRKKAKS